MIDLRRMIRRGGLITLCLMMICCSSGLGEGKQRFQATFLELFDTVTMVLGFEENQQAFDAEAARIHDELEAYDHLYDIYHEYPDLVNLCSVNNHPGETLTVDRRIIDLLLLTREIDEASGHRTDAMFGAVLRVWHEARENGINHPEEAFLPEIGDLETAAAHTGFQHLEIDENACTVRITDPEASLDVGAIAKGYAAQRVAETLPEGYMLSVGGNVVATGPKPDGAPWTVGVQNPENPEVGYLHRLRIEKGAVVTSGDYQRYYIVEGKRYHHIIDPETLFPGEKWRAITVIAADSGLADGLSTSLFLMSQEEGQQLIERYGAEALWIAQDGTQMFSPGYQDYLIP